MSTSTIDAPAAETLSYQPLRAELTAQDRCDACGAQAYVAVEAYGSELLYCAHHASKYEAKLKAVATSWHDERSKLKG